MSAETLQHHWERRHATLYRVRVSVLYHLKRARFFDGLDKALSVATAVAATAAVGVLLKQAPGFELVCAAATAALAVAQLVIGPGLLARTHAQAAADFRRVQADALATGEQWSAAQCDAFAARVLELEAGEPAPLAALVADCQNQLAVATGAPQVRLSWLERRLMHWCDFDAARIARRVA